MGSAVRSQRGQVTKRNDWMGQGVNVALPGEAWAKLASTTSATTQLLGPACLSPRLHLARVVRSTLPQNAHTTPRPHALRRQAPCAPGTYATRLALILLGTPHVHASVKCQLHVCEPDAAEASFTALLAHHICPRRLYRSPNRQKSRFLHPDTLATV